jgi:hypothetical protein
MANKMSTIGLSLFCDPAKVGFVTPNRVQKRESMAQQNQSAMPCQKSEAASMG